MSKKKDLAEYKCPIPGCKKKFIGKWRLINHVRQSRSMGHGEMGKIPEGFNPETVEYIKPQVKPEDTLNVSPDEVKPHEVEHVKHVEVVELPKKQPVVKCPECGADKADWIKLSNLDADDPQPTEEQLKEYDYVCSKCRELIKVGD